LIVLLAYFEYVVQGADVEKPFIGSEERLECLNREVQFLECFIGVDFLELVVQKCDNFR
jgi:hypothetical protein